VASSGRADAPPETASASSSIRSRSSIRIRSASFEPTPGTERSVAMRAPRIASSSAAGVIPERIVCASRGPTRLARSSSSKATSSARVAKPKSWIAPSLACVCTCSATCLPSSGSSVKVERGIWTA